MPFMDESEPNPMIARFNNCMKLGKYEIAFKVARSMENEILMEWAAREQIALLVNAGDREAAECFAKINRHGHLLPEFLIKYDGPKPPAQQTGSNPGSHIPWEFGTVKRKVKRVLKIKDADQAEEALARQQGGWNLVKTLLKEAELAQWEAERFSGLRPRHQIDALHEKALEYVVRVVEAFGGLENVPEGILEGVTSSSFDSLDHPVITPSRRSGRGIARERSRREFQTG